MASSWQRWWAAAIAATLVIAMPAKNSTAPQMPIPTKEIAPGVHMPVISIGTGGLEMPAAADIVANWLALGGRGIDTALIYFDQAVIPEQLKKAKVNRSEVFITSKIPGCAGAEAAVQYDLNRLQTDYIDLLLIHFPKGDCAAAWSVLETFHKRGILKAIGVSNFGREHLEGLLRTATVPPAVNQIELNVLGYDAEAVAFAQSRNITTEAYSPLGRSGHSGDVPGNEVVRSVAAKHGVSSYQVALRWIMQNGHLLTFQSRSRAHQASDADIFGFNLSDAEMRALDAQRHTADPARQDAGAVRLSTLMV